MYANLWLLVLIGSDSSTCTSVTTITGTASATNASTSSTLSVSGGLLHGGWQDAML